MPKTKQFQVLLRVAFLKPAYSSDKTRSANFIWRGLSRGCAPWNPESDRNREGGVIVARPSKAGISLGARMTLRGKAEMFDEWKSAAKLADLSVSDWLRVSVNPTTQMSFRRTPRKRPALREISPADPVLIAKIATLGNNMHQVAKWANVHKSTADAIQVLLALAAIEAQLSVLLKL